MANDQRDSRRDVWAVLPAKEVTLAKERLARALTRRLRRDFALAMLEDVIEALAGVAELSGIVVVTVDRHAAEIAMRYGAHVWTEGARDSHTGAVTAAARRLAASGCSMLTIPGDVPLVESNDIARVLRLHSRTPSFTIVPAWDESGSNTIVCSPADVVPLRFGPDSFFPHLAAAQRVGLKPTIVHNTAIALDIDEPADLSEFMRHRPRKRSWTLLDRRRAEWDRAPATVVGSP
jgi:2-phospho-L-lactate/phosphoenolpyruvate guanylyltransferase